MPGPTILENGAQPVAHAVAHDVDAHFATAAVDEKIAAQLARRRHHLRLLDERKPNLHRQPAHPLPHPGLLVIVL
jgi:hypothetical protein